MRSPILALISVLSFSLPCFASSLDERLSTPPLYERLPQADSSFASWLRKLPLKPAGSKVMLHNGNPKPNQSAHTDVVDISVGHKDLQQCADAWMRLRAEYLRDAGRANEIEFRFTSGDLFRYQDWLKGSTPKVQVTRVKWQTQSPREDNPENFSRYLEIVFMYAGSHSLSEQLTKKAVKAIEPGDLFLEGGFPGHAVIVMDVAVHQETGEKIFLLAQSFMPAQDIHILKNPNADVSPWYRVPKGRLLTPEWQFRDSDLYGFR